MARMLRAVDDAEKLLSIYWHLFGIANYTVIRSLPGHNNDRYYTARDGLVKNVSLLVASQCQNRYWSNIDLSSGHNGDVTLMVLLINTDTVSGIDRARRRSGCR